MTAPESLSTEADELRHLEDNIATVAHHLGQPGARLSVSHDGPGLVVDPGEVLKEISRRLGIAQAKLDPFVEGAIAEDAKWPDPILGDAPDKGLELKIEQLLFNRVVRNRIAGYTIETAQEIVGLIGAAYASPGHLSLREEFIEGRPVWRIVRIVPETKTIVSSFRDRESAEVAFKGLLLPSTDREGE